MAESVLLKGGPFDDTWVTIEWGSTLICEGDGVPEAMVARYRPTRQRGVYRFRGCDKIVARLQHPAGVPQEKPEAAA